MGSLRRQKRPQTALVAYQVLPASLGFLCVGYDQVSLRQQCLHAIPLESGTNIVGLKEV